MIEWTTQHGTDLWTIFATMVTLASLIVKLTPSRLDDNIIMRLVNLVSLARKK